MNANLIDIALLQETHIAGEKREIRKKHTWFFSGGRDEGTIHHGIVYQVRAEAQIGLGGGRVVPRASRKTPRPLGLLKTH